MAHSVDTLPPPRVRTAHGAEPLPHCVRHVAVAVASRGGASMKITNLSESSMRRVTLPFLLVALAACTAPAGASNPSVTPTAPASPSPTPAVVDPDAIVLRVEMVGGFVAPDSLLTRMPIQSIYADGRVFEQGAIPEIYPGPLVAPTLVSQLTPDGLAIVQQAIDAAGLVNASYPPFGIADAPDTQVTASTSNGMVTVTVGAATPNASFAPGEAAQRAAVEELLAQVVNLPELVGNENIGPAEPYSPDALRLVLRVGQKPDDGMNPKPLDWPLDTPIATFGEPTSFGESRCGAVDGADAQSLWAVLSTANQNQYFEQKGVVYLPAARPLLPGEPVSCTDATTS
jgi:hypothetical protein